MSLGPFDPQSQKKMNAQQIAKEIKYGPGQVASKGNSKLTKATGVGAG